jgi:protease-4
MRAALALALLCAACDPRLYAAKDREPERPPEEKEKPAADEPSPFALLGALGRARAPGPFDEPQRSAGLKDDQPYAAVLELSGQVVELDAPFSLSLTKLGGEHALTLRALTARLAKLDADPKVAAIVLRLGALELPLARAEELRGAVAALGKPVWCHAEQLDSHTLVLASACRRIGMVTGGTVAALGPALVPVYLKGLLDLIGVEADFVHIGAYKGAAEPLTRTEPSPEMRQTYADLLDGAYGRTLALVAAGRHVDEKKVAGWIDEGLFMADAAARAGIIDEVASFEAFRAAASGGAWRKVKIVDKGGDDLFALLGMGPKHRVGGPHVALLYAVGEVIDGRGGVGGAYENVASERLCPALHAAAADGDVKAIVLRVDSPGGSALASEVIWNAVHDAAAKKPVMVSMGALAASGGYYISVAGGRIFAQPDTLTGSIGVVGGKLVLGGALDKVGVHAEELGRGKRALLFSPVRRWSDDERAAVRAEMEATYALFKARVGAGRGLDAKRVEDSAQGRVFTGAEAKRRGLVDELGGLDDALAAARAAAKLPRDAAVDVYPGEPTLLDFLGGLGGGGAGTALYGDALARATPLLGPAAGRALTQALELAFGFAAGPVRAVAFVPAVE